MWFWLRFVGLPGDDGAFHLGSLLDTATVCGVSWTYEDLHEARSLAAGADGHCSICQNRAAEMLGLSRATIDALREPRPEA